MNRKVFLPSYSMNRKAISEVDRKHGAVTQPTISSQNFHLALFLTQIGRFKSFRPPLGKERKWLLKRFL